MRLSSLARNAFEALEVPQDILLGRYPEFVTGGPLARGDIPIFVFHSLEPVSFERRLRYLAENGYRALSADELFYGLMGATKVRDRAVALTFDDGRGSLFGVGLPLMRRYGFRGIVFLVPGRVPTGGGLPPTWDDVEAGRVPAARVLDREREAPLLSWVEIEAMARTGLFDFQSHTLTHSRVHTHPEVVGFVTPRSRRGYEAFDTPLGEQEGRDLLAEELPLGTPILRSEPRTSESAPLLRAPRVPLGLSGRRSSRRRRELLRPPGLGKRSSGVSLAGHEDHRTTRRRRSSGGKPSTPSSSNPSASSKSASAGPSSTSATPGTPRVPPRAASPARSATGAASPGRSREYPSPAPDRTRSSRLAWARTTSSSSPGGGEPVSPPSSTRNGHAGSEGRWCNIRGHRRSLP